MLRKILFTVFIFSGLSGLGQNANTFFIPFRENSSGVLEVDVKINEYPSSFIFDPGATLVSFGKAFYDSLTRNAFFISADIKYKTQTKMANGSLANALVVNLKLLTLGDFKIKDVEAMVLDDINAPCLIGQSVIQKFSTVTIDNKNKRLILGEINSGLAIKLDEVRFIPCSTQVAGELEKIKKAVEGDSLFGIKKVSQEVNIPPEKSIKRLPAKITIRYFDINDLDKAISVYDKILQMGYSANQVANQDMTPYYTNAIPGYIEIWIK